MNRSLRATAVVMAIVVTAAWNTGRVSAGVAPSPSPSPSASPSVAVAAIDATVTTVGSGPSRAALVIDTGTEVKKTCVRFAAPKISGAELLKAAGVDPVFAAIGPGLAVCALCGKGCPGDGSCLTCQQPQYWSYWRGAPGASALQYSVIGASATNVFDGSVEAWAWNEGKVAPSDISFVQICGLPTDQVPQVVSTIAAAVTSINAETPSAATTSVAAGSIPNTSLTRVALAPNTTSPNTTSPNTTTRATSAVSGAPSASIARSATTQVSHTDDASTNSQATADTGEGRADATLDAPIDAAAGITNETFGDRTPATTPTASASDDSSTSWWWVFAFSALPATITAGWFIGRRRRKLE